MLRTVFVWWLVTLILDRYTAAAVAGEVGEAEHGALRWS